MQFVAILLAVLKLLGLVILSFFILIIFLLFLVFFIPITYNVKAGYINSELNIKAEAGWFFNFIHLIYNYSEKLFSIKICGFKLNTKKNKKDVKSEEVNINKNDTLKNKGKEDISENTNNSEANKSDKDITIASNSEADESDKNITIDSKTENLNINNKIISDNKKSDLHESDDNDTANINVSRNENDEDISDGTKASSYDKIKKILDLLQSDNFKEAFSYSKNKIIKLLKYILPRKWNIYARLGFDDPSVTGKVMAFAGIIYPFTYKHIQIKGEFENNIIEVDSYFKGHVTLFKIVLTGTLVYFNKNIRKIIKSFKEVM